tara:strand:+ start:1204 stop:1710 length:507 start_codon:yes stop_codon:yes gene_type:complete
MKITYQIIFLSFFLSCCTVIKKDYDRYADIENLKKVIPKFEKYSKYGNPKTYKVFGVQYKTLKSHIGYSEEGTASWYGKKFHGKLTSSREKYDMYKLTAAHKTLPIPCYVKVTNLKNGISIIVRVNDRGPFKKGRIIDLSYAAAVKLDIVTQGTEKVYVEAINVSKNN